VPSRHLPSFPLNLALVPRAILDPRLFQAPLTAARGEGASGADIGTERWCTVAPGYTGEVRVLYPEPGLGAQFGNGVGFPDVKALSIGLWWSKANILFSDPVILNVSPTDVRDAEDKKTK